jgi:hypothetical protein
MNWRTFKRLMIRLTRNKYGFKRVVLPIGRKIGHVGMFVGTLPTLKTAKQALF